MFVDGPGCHYHTLIVNLSLTREPFIGSKRLSESSPKRSESATGVLYGVAAFGAWGLCPIYFKAVSRVDPLEVLCHRVIWSVIFLTGLLVVTRRFGAVRRLLRHRTAMLGLVVSTGLIAVNWYVFIWAVGNDQMVQASLGYFINPLVNVLLGFVFLRETQRTWQLASILLALVGVSYMTVSVGSVPWVALVLAFSFGFYGLVRKLVAVEAIVGLTVETVLLLVPAVLMAVHLDRSGQASFGAVSGWIDGLLVAAGVVTAVPLLWFTAAARRLRLPTLGFIQYLAPSGQFLLAVLYYHEPFHRHTAISFGFIWFALGIYSWDAMRRRPQAITPVAAGPTDSLVSTAMES